ncbi:unnamed protein product [Closterium sp. Yama58-4]|nr:unnamed protein product [Closterium sp. Yama58-4]
MEAERRQTRSQRLRLGRLHRLGRAGERRRRGASGALEPLKKGANYLPLNGGLRLGRTATAKGVAAGLKVWMSLPAWRAIDWLPATGGGVGLPVRDQGSGGSEQGWRQSSLGP